MRKYGVWEQICNLIILSKDCQAGIFYFKRQKWSWRGRKLILLLKVALFPHSIKFILGKGHGKCYCGNCYCGSGWHGDKCEFQCDITPWESKRRCTSPDGKICSNRGVSFIHVTTDGGGELLIVNTPFLWISFSMGGSCLLRCLTLL